MASEGAVAPQAKQIQTGAYRNERQLNYLPDGVWLKNLISSRNQRSFVHFAVFRVFPIHPHLPAYETTFETYGPNL